MLSFSTSRPLLSSSAVVLALISFSFTQCSPPQDKTTAKAKPIITLGGKVGDLLRQWWKEGTAAGNEGDYYDNRDGAHSDLDTAPYPQLKRIVYSAEEIKLRKHWAAQRVILPHVVFGNSSTSAPPLAGGSNPRMYYTQGSGLAFLYQQYTKNNIYIYPEHRDHDPGRNGPDEGFGDLYPTNTPFLIISQGSSGSDQPFMRALAVTLAAFRPEVKKKLIDSGLLMPTFQMLLRTTSKHLKGPEEYLTAKAHPSVFEGSNVDDLAMVEAAHAIEAGNIPPMVHLKVLEEDEPVLGKDFFAARGSEQLADTPAVIARIFRGKNSTRRMIVSAEGSFDVNKRPLTFRWIALRGDAAKLKITPLNKEQSKVEIVVPYPERRPIAPGSNMESNRIDIGVFVHNGAYYSAPGFITYFSLDHEARTYDANGRILEIGYGMGETKPIVRDWPLFCAAAAAEQAGLLLGLSTEDRNLLRKAGPEIQQRRATIEQSRGRLREIDKTIKELSDLLKKTGAQVIDEQLVRKKEQAVKERQAVEKEVQAKEKELADYLNQTSLPSKTSLNALAAKVLKRNIANSAFYTDNAARWSPFVEKASPARKAAFDAARKKVVAMGLVKEAPAGALVLTFLQGARATAYEKFLLERFHAAVLENLVFPDSIAFATPTNATDQPPSAPRLWRDVYRYDPKGHYLGWTRFDDTDSNEFNPDGYMVLERDALGRCKKARTVRYEQGPPSKFGMNNNPLQWHPEETLITYVYAGPDDWFGKTVKEKRQQE